MDRRAENLCICGLSGIGKSHLAEALAHAAIDAGETVAWHTIESVATLMRRHRADDSVSKAIGRLIRADLIVIDLCRHRDYADTPRRAIVNCVRALDLLGVGAVGIVTDFRGRRGACRGACSGRVWRRPG
jgi:chromosomal replication initiation ATPase DnaA